MNKPFISCKGPVSSANKIGRRELLRLGLGGFTSLSMPGLFNLRSQGATDKHSEKTAIILVWLRGGCSHLDTFDRSPMRQQSTVVHLSKLIPKYLESN